MLPAGLKALGLDPPGTVQLLRLGCLFERAVCKSTTRLFSLVASGQLDPAPGPPHGEPREQARQGGAEPGCRGEQARRLRRYRYRHVGLQHRPLPLHHRRRPRKPRSAHQAGPSGARHAGILSAATCRNDVRSGRSRGVDSQADEHRRKAEGHCDGAEGDEHDGSLQTEAAHQGVSRPRPDSDEARNARQLHCLASTLSWGAPTLSWRLYTWLTEAPHEPAQLTPYRARRVEARGRGAARLRLSRRRDGGGAGGAPDHRETLPADA